MANSDGCCGHVLRKEDGHVLRREAEEDMEEAG